MSWTSKGIVGWDYGHFRSRTSPYFKSSTMQFGSGAEGCLTNNAWRQTKPSCVPRLEGNTEEAYRWGNRTINIGGTWNAPAPQFTASSATIRLAPPVGYTMSYDAAGNLTYDNYSGSGARLRRREPPDFGAGLLRANLYLHLRRGRQAGAVRGCRRGRRVTGPRDSGHRV
jgi:hypothetical protein